MGGYPPERDFGATLAVALTSCSGQPSAATDAHTRACRTYRLQVAGQDQGLALLMKDAARSGGWDNGQMNHALDRVKVAVAAAGSTPGLAQQDFEVYGHMADELGKAYILLNLSEGSSRIFDRRAANDYTTALAKVRGLC